MIRDAVRYNLSGPLEEWRALRTQIAARVLQEGYDPVRNTFVQSFGSQELDASLLLIPMSGFLAPDDPRVLGTVRAIEEDLLQDGFVVRYRTSSEVDGLPGGEGAFLACTFWLVEVYALQGRTDDARALFERLLSYENDVGLLAEEYDPVTKRQVGNFPQAFSHVALIAAAMTLSGQSVGHASRARRASDARHASAKTLPTAA